MLSFSSTPTQDVFLAALLIFKWFLLQTAFCFCISKRALKPLGVYVVIFEALLLGGYYLHNTHSISSTWSLFVLLFDCFGAIIGVSLSWLVYAVYLIVKRTAKKAKNKRGVDTSSEQPIVE